MTNKEYGTSLFILFVFGYLSGMIFERFTGLMNKAIDCCKSLKNTLPQQITNMLTGYSPVNDTNQENTLKP